ncbi:unnamed protein product [Rhizophagus irregularis]|uniref:MATA-HMG n=1 Tax=Rhizophagus irregularis TaxID=588596 RepID=R9UBK4_9GLOM|nr:MATA_HMG [Rhizophagus irregularis]ANQ33100.1 MATA-HMG [Rhizophagus irregularis]PKK80894.1 hypothetical protein RhiirC2_841300 [Rhizophagus irregularis]CAB4392437.1 unnamed protein product [Rhizophagus irregularis]CAB5345788.1 unnamed protein product [Rhizophagus irregularis]
MAQESLVTDISELTLQVRSENKEELDNLLISFEKRIDNNEMPKANEILRHQDSDKKIKRPPNSNIIYTNQIGKYGLLDIIRNFCDKNGINKQKLVPISIKLSKILWKDLSNEHQNFFEELALKVNVEHKKLYPNYKYVPVIKRKARTTYKLYDFKTETDDSSLPLDEQVEEHYEDSTSSSTKATENKLTEKQDELDELILDSSDDEN